MTMTIDSVQTDPITSAGTCPPWCIGAHSRPPWVTEAEAPRYWHISAECPSWCSGHPDYEQLDGCHASLRAEVELTLAGKPVETFDGDMRADFIETSVWQMPDAPAPVVAIMHGADDTYLPDMTPAEARTLAASLMQAADRADAPHDPPPLTTASAVGSDRRPARSAQPCPPWCDIEDHDDYDGDGKMCHTLTWCVPVSAYPYDVMGERQFDSIMVSRKQVGGGQPVFLIEAPGTMADAKDPDGLIKVPGQFIMTILEAMELAATLLHLAVWGKPLQQGGGEDNPQQPETGMPSAAAARWLREMGLTDADIRQMGETEPLFAQMTAALSAASQHV
jgi:uncharacterized protein DUF6907